tara:strand:- start:1282 stop:1503 length:222 start_codon:yes stop_codon:yes gene_type:complete
MIKDKRVTRKGKRFTFRYHCPTDSNDLKRDGKSLKITLTDPRVRDVLGVDLSLDLNGTQINTLKGILMEAGEI